ncbi:MAG: AMP-binding protein, partial [Parahaliea sp.]
MKKSYVAGTTEYALRDITLGELLADAAHAHPGRLALIAGVANPAERTRWTFAELYAESQAVARVLAEDFEPGERVAVWAGSVPEWVMLEFGAAMAGVILVTVNPSFQASELQYVLTQSRASGLFLQHSCRGNPLAAHAQSVRHNCHDLRSITSLDDWHLVLERGRA